MILRAAGRTWCGAVVDLREADVDPAAVAAAVRGDSSPYGAHCPPPGEVHRRAGFVRPGMGLEPRTALAAAGRSRELSTPHDQVLRRVRERLASFEGPPDSPRTGSASGAADVERERERVAELRGRVRALEARGHDAADERAALREAARRLSELETERVAAVETRLGAREARDRRERRLRLQDRAANLARDARAHLVRELRGEFAAAVDALSADTVDEPFRAPPVTCALAVLRVARVRAPVVLAADRFEGPERAARWLDAPVVRA